MKGEKNKRISKNMENKTHTKIIFFIVDLIQPLSFKTYASVKADHNGVIKIVNRI
jgi:hypothetical protein